MRVLMLLCLVVWMADVLAQDVTRPPSAGSESPSSELPSAADESNLVDRLAQVREQLAAAQRERIKRSAEVDRSLAALAQVDRQITQRKQVLKGLTDEAARLEQKWVELIAERARLETALSGEKESLAALLRSTYALGRLDTLKLVLAQDQLADTGRLLAFQTQLQRVRVTRIDRVRDLLQALEALRIETTSAQTALAAVRQQELENLSALQGERGKRSAILKELRSALAKVEARVEDLDQDRSDIEGLLEQLRAVIGDVPSLLPEDRPFSELRGRLLRPLAGTPSIRFGEQHMGRASAGVRIEAPRGTQIKAVARGRVAFADQLRGYGLLLIVDHGDGYMSLYARCESLLPSEGAWIEAGSPVGLVGNSGGANETALYFELRHRGQALDPAAWWGK